MYENKKLKSFIMEQVVLDMYEDYTGKCYHIYFRKVSSTKLNTLLEKENKLCPRQEKRLTKRVTDP
jgi:hypothetical protein